MFLQNHATWAEIQQFFHIMVAGAAGVVFSVVVLLTYLGILTFIVCSTVCSLFERCYVLYELSQSKVLNSFKLYVAK